MLPFRQIHLDFHTSQHIPDIASQFDPNEFADTMRKSHVNSVTCFSRGHHGYLYYDSKKFPERIHPNLVKRNLLKEQVDSLHKRGIRAPIYITVQWDKYTAIKHPEWISVDNKGNRIGTELFDIGFYEMLCVNTPYRDFLREQTMEILETFNPVDGIFFDITYYHECCCKYCLDCMRKEGYDIADKKQRMNYSKKMLDAFKEEMKELVHGYNKNASVYFNTSHISTEERKSLSACTHLEIESLPSGDYGYLHFPITMRYARQLGKECVGMNGKFHTEWADFHSFKNPAALEFECFNIVALNGKIICGDQLHPNGKICPFTYELIGGVYEKIEKIEPYLIDAVPIVEIGVFNSDEFSRSSRSHLPSSIRGATRMLQELSYQFDIIDSESNFENYKLLILPDEIYVNETFADKLKAYAAKGGKLILSHESGLDRDENCSHIQELLGITYQGPLTYSPDYIVPKGPIGEGLHPTEYVMYYKGTEVKATDAKVLIMNHIPYFNRTWEHFCSHRQTPSSGVEESPAIVQKESTIYFSHPIFTQYDIKGTLWVKRLLANGIKKLMPQAILQHSGPSTLLTTVNRQEIKNRDVIHVLHYIPERRCLELDIIEDIIPLYNLELTYRSKEKVKAITLEDGIALHFVQTDAAIKVNVPKLEGHALVIIHY